MLPCNACHRHIHDDESACPFCGAKQRRESSPLRELVGVLGVSMALLGSAACTPTGVPDPQANTSTDPSGSSDTDSDSDTTPDTSAETSTSTTWNGTDDTTDPQTNTSGGFYAGPDVDIGQVSQCDPFAQDCPEGEKCVAYADDGVTWNANRCVQLMGAGEPGDECVYGGIIESTDNCNGESFCFYAEKNEDQLFIGECRAFCTGTADDPICPPDEACLISNQGSLNLCLPTCDPIAQDCPGEAQSCYWAGNEFMCFLAEEPDPEGSCALLNDCPAGQACLSAEYLPGCESAACCTDYCDVQDLEACPDEGVECVPFFEDPIPPEYEQYANLGVCISPQP